jgi:hypothetical protein
MLHFFLKTKPLYNDGISDWSIFLATVHVHLILLLHSLKKKLLLHKYDTRNVLFFLGNARIATIALQDKGLPVSLLKSGLPKLAQNLQPPPPCTDLLELEKFEYSLMF